MVQNIIETPHEPLNANVIKVTIKDKPGLHRQTNGENLKIIFQALREHAKQEGRLRNLRIVIDNKRSKRTLRRYFHIWYNLTLTMRKKSEYTKVESKMLNDKKIELLVNAIAEKQNAIAINSEKLEKQKHSSRTNTASVSVNKQKERLRGRIKVKDTSKTPNLNRLEVQKIIIEEQRAKLAEQNKCIHDLKLKEIDKETKLTSQQTINVAKQALSQCDQRTRRSIIHLMREEGCRDKSITEIPRIPSPPRFLIRMEARAEARKQRMKLADESRQRKREEEKKKEEISLQKAEEEQRQQQIQVIKNIKKLRKEQEDRRLKEIEKNDRLEYLAKQLYRKYLFRRYVLEPLNKLVEQKYKRLHKADQHYEETLLIKIYFAWKNEWVEHQKAKLKLAIRLHRHTLLWYAFDEWKTLTLNMKQKYQVAVDFYDMKIQGKYIQVWHLFYAKIKFIMCEKEVIAIKHHEDHLKFMYFNMWKQYMSIADDIKEREQRRDEWRDLIKKFIPDTSKP